MTWLFVPRRLIVPVTFYILSIEDICDDDDPTKAGEAVPAVADYCLLMT